MPPKKASPSSSQITVGHEEPRLKISKQALNHYRKFPQYFREYANQGLLLEIEQLKKENKILREENMNLMETAEDLKDTMLLSCWDDHGYMSLKKAFESFNRKPDGLACCCENCVLRTGDEIVTTVGNRDCFFFDTIRPLLLTLEISFAIEDPFETFSDDLSFHPNLASKYFHTVSSMNVALVFPCPDTDPFRVYYGRKLWEIEDPFDNLEIEKLRLLKERLYYKPPVSAFVVQCSLASMSSP
jgi:hypothetical protein